MDRLCNSGDAVRIGQVDVETQQHLTHDMAEGRVVQNVLLQIRFQLFFFEEETYQKFKKKIAKNEITKIRLSNFNCLELA